MADLHEIGNPLRMSPRIDPENKMTNYIRASMMVIDLVPVQQMVDVLSISPNNPSAVSYSFSEEVDIFRNMCSSYGLTPADGVRLWCTDETVIQDEFSNQYTQNFLESVVDKAANIRNWLNTIRMVQKSDVTAREIVNKIENTIETGASMLGGETAKQVIREGFDIAIKGKHISLPKVWSSSNYNPAIVLNVKLISPYGTPRAIKRFIIEPLTYLLLLSSPRSENAITYGYPASVYIKAYGIATIRAGFIENVSVKRGGADLTYNQYRQPMMLNVSLTIRPMVEGFAAIKNGEHINVDIVEQTDNDMSMVPGGNPGGGSVNTVGDIIKSFRPFNYVPAKSRNLERGRSECVEPSRSSASELRRSTITRESNQIPSVLNEPISYEQTGNPIEHIADEVVDSVTNNSDINDILYNITQDDFEYLGKYL